MTDKKKYSFPNNKIKVLLLENIHPIATNLFMQEEFQVETFKTSLSEQKLIQKIKDVHIIGIRSKTELTEHVLSHAEKLIAVGIYCIGTNQVNKHAAMKGKYSDF
jgi:Phosphoglycerate dehydrogenase and related dehydrogenases